MPKCIVMNIEDPKNKKFYVCVNGDAFEGPTDVEIDLHEKFIGALENTVIDTMVPDPDRIGKLGQVVKVSKKEYRFRVVRLERAEKAEEEHTKKPRGNPNWIKKDAEPTLSIGQV